jgi:hypothetical protein
MYLGKVMLAIRKTWLGYLDQFEVLFQVKISEEKVIDIVVNNSRSITQKVW